jgi:hypothetical protein
MQLSVRAFLPLMLIAAVISASIFSPALAREPVPVQERAFVDPYFADPGEDPHLSILEEPASPTSGGNDTSAACERGDGGAGNDRRYRRIRSAKFDIFLFSIYNTLGLFLF